MSGRPARLGLIGGAEDPQLARLAAAAEARGVEIVRLLTGAQGPPRFTWTFGAGLMDETGAPLFLDAAFMRQDVFRYLRTRAEIDQIDARAWKIALDGWLMSSPGIRRFNARFAMREGVNKPYALTLAAAHGLRIPETTIATDVRSVRALVEGGEVVYKPVAGGDHCRVLEAGKLDMYGDGALPRPYIFQERLVAPELRVFRVGERFVTFEIASPSLDYRERQDARLTPVETPAEVIAGLRAVSETLGLDYAAADFKTSASSSELAFMEINSNPMFAAFDTVGEGSLCAAMLDWLCVGPRGSSE